MGDDTQLWADYGRWVDALARTGTHIADFEQWRSWRPDLEPGFWDRVEEDAETV